MTDTHPVESRAELPAHLAPLAARCREIHALEGAADALAWDQEVMMPPGGLEARADQLELLARLQHERLTAPEFGEALHRAADGLTADDADWAANVRELTRRRAAAAAVPADLVARAARTHSLAQAAWAEARARSDFAAFAPWLDRVFGIARERAAALRAALPDEGFGEAWDALADGYEPGVRATTLAALFDGLVPRLAALVDRVRGLPAPKGAGLRDLAVPIAAQDAFVRSVATSLGFDLQRGRIDRSTHPFCSGTHPGDVRLTTRFLETDFLDGLGSTMHETGHALYEQGLPPEFAGTPRGQAASLGLHESQSRLWENHVGRGRAFWTWAFPRAREAFAGTAFSQAGWDADDVFRAANRVEPSLIRVEADEVTYDLHVALRFDLERALVRGDLAVADLPGAWSERMMKSLGIEVPDDARGCLQDVHWSCGLVGYFPTYTLGNVWAAELFAKAHDEIGDLDERIAAGEFAPLREWLRERVHRFGTATRAPDRMRAILGRDPSPDAMLAHLEARLDAVYGTG
jgi:carboxypeptidase Taq